MKEDGAKVFRRKEEREGGREGGREGRMYARYISMLKNEK